MNDAAGIVRIGLTGGIGSGKSTVAHHLRGLGVPVLDLDELSRDALATDAEAIAETADRFGPTIVSGDGTIDRRALGRIVFHDARAKADLERIVLARVGAGAQRWDAAQAAQGRRVVVHDSPLLLEQGQDQRYRAVIAVLARREERLARLVASRDRTREHFESVMANQVTDRERIRRADALILNTGDEAVLAARTARAWRRVAGAGGADAAH